MRYMALANILINLRHRRIEAEAGKEYELSEEEAKRIPSSYFKPASGEEKTAEKEELADEITFSEKKKKR